MLLRQGQGLGEHGIPEKSPKAKFNCRCVPQSQQGRGRTNTGARAQSEWEMVAGQALLLLWPVVGGGWSTEEMFTAGSGAEIG